MKMQSLNGLEMAQLFLQLPKLALNIHEKKCYHHEIFAL